MLVSLYTVRVVLATLGAEDYGIYNVVAGVVVLFSFVNNAMATATQRFLNFNLGKGDISKTQQIYSTSLIIHLLIALFFAILAESVGFWFVKTKLNIPFERHNAAIWCYQFSVITTVINILRVPYNAVIIAYEKMSFFAFISIIESVLKLLIVYLLLISSYDKLIVYVILLAFVSLIISLCYKFFCNRNFEIAHYKKVTDLVFIKELLSFSGWSLFGAASNVANQQGTNIIMNIFTNVTVNAAMGIANNINNAVYSFISNFQTAFNPQLVKSYATKNPFFNELVLATSKLSFFLLFIIVLPLIVNAEFILNLWLETIPEYSVSFVRLMLIWSLVDVFNNPLYTCIQATGSIKKYNILVSIFKLIPLPLIYVFLFLDYKPIVILYIEIFVSLFINIWRILFASKKCNIKSFFNKVIFPCISISVITSFVIYFLTKFILNNTNSLLNFLLSCFLCLISSLIFIFLLGFSYEEKLVIINKIQSFFKEK